MGRDGQRRLVGEKGKKDFQGYGMFGGSSVVACEGPVLQRGGAWRRINGRDCGGEVRRWERRGSHGHCGGLQSVIFSHQHILEHTAVATGLSPQPSIPEGLTHCQITRYRGQQGHRNHHQHWHTCTRGFCSSDCQMPNSRVRGGWAHVGTNLSVCARAHVWVLLLHIVCGFACITLMQVLMSEILLIMILPSSIVKRPPRG